MAVNRLKFPWAVRGVGVTSIVGVVLALTTGSAWASGCGSDGRGSANLFGNPRTCADIGLRGDSRVGSSVGRDASDFNVAGWIKTNRGETWRWSGQELDIGIKGPMNVVVDAVVVAGGDRYTVYRNHRFLPPALGPDQHYIAPFDTMHRIPRVTSWFTCYHVDPSGALPDVPQVLDIPLAGGGIVAAWMLLRRRRLHAADAQTSPAG